MKAKWLTLGFAVSACFSGALAEKTGRTLVRNVDGVDAVMSVFRSAQFRSPPAVSGKLVVYDAGYLVFDPGADAWPAALIGNLAPEGADDGSVSWPFSMCEDAVTHEIRFLNRNGDVIHTVAAEAGYDPSWVFHQRFHSLDGAELPDGVKRYEACLSPSRVLLRGRFALADNSAVAAAKAAFVQEPSAENGRRTSPDGSASAGSSRTAALSSPYRLAAMSALSDPHGIDGSNPGFPPAGYKDYLYVQVGQDRPYLVNAQTNVRSLVQASFCSIAVFADGTVSGLGYDPLAFDTCSSTPIPPKVKWFYMPPGLTNVVAGTTSWSNYFMFLLGNKRVVGWGGPQNILDRDKVPARVTNAVAVVSGFGHAAALLSNSNVVAWGDNWVGQTNVPPGLQGVKALAAGDSHTLALLYNGRVVAWGDNGFGQTNVPSNVTNAVAVAAGYGHSLALLADGRVVAWGASVTPEGVTDATGIAAGWDHSVALLGDGSVYVWGDDSYGQCSPPASLGQALGVSACFHQTGALLEDGSATVWGDSGGSFPEIPLSVLGQVSECRVLQTAFASGCTPSVLMAIVRAPATGIAALDGDSDGDGLSLFEEQAIFGTNSSSSDSDADGLTDGQETLPFLALWEPSNTNGVCLFGYDPVKVVASDSMRAALLRDGKVVVFTGEGQGLLAYTNACGAVDIDASDTWIAALLPKGDVSVMRENSGTLAVTAMGFTNVVEISGGLDHLLLRHANGKISCLKEGTAGAPVNYTSTGFSSITNAARISAGSGCDAVLLASCAFRFGNALLSTSPASVAFAPDYAGYPVDVSAGSNQCYAVLFVGGAAAAYRSGMTNLISSGVASVAANGDSRLLAVMADGVNRTFSVTGTVWESASVTNDLLNARSLWWRRNCRAAVSAGGALMPISGAAASGRKLVFQGAAVTPGGLARGIASAFTGTCATNAFSDADSMSDGWEFRYNLNPLDASDQYLDGDGDGLTNSLEYACQTDPNNWDSDGDGTYSDGWEYFNGFNPALAGDTGADSDGDGLPDGVERLIGTNMNAYDSDGDGLGDGAETTVPFLTLWNSTGRVERVSVDCQVSQVTASDTLRAALLSDGKVLVFSGTGAELVARTNDCGAVEIDATESWVAARQADGRVRVWGFLTNGTFFASDAGLTNVVGISCGYRHLLALHSGGSVSCVTNAPFGTPALLTNTFSKACTNALSVSAGIFADAAVLKSGKLLLGNVFLTTTPSTVTPAATPVDVVSGSNRNYVVQLATGQSYAYVTTLSYAGPTGTLYIAGGGSTNLMAVLSDGRNAFFRSGGTGWAYNTLFTNRLADARDLWWRRNCGLAVRGDGVLLPLARASASTQRLDYCFAAVTPGGLALGIAAACSATCPTNRDTDADGLVDGDEVVLGTDPNLKDTDGDGLDDGREVALGTGPALKDTDGDGFRDGWEVKYGFDPLVAETDGLRIATADPDGDGLDNSTECANGTDPFSSDTDADDLSDGAETERPFLALWDASNNIEKIDADCRVSRVAASGSLRAALLANGHTLVFKGTGGGLQVVTNTLQSVELDSTDEWIAARQANGFVRVWRIANGTIVESDAGLSDVEQISGGFQHLLARHSDGHVSCIKRDSSGAPVILASPFCSAATNALSVSAGREADIVLLENNKVLAGTAFSTNRMKWLGPYTDGVIGVAAGSNYTFAVGCSNIHFALTWAPASATYYYKASSTSGRTLRVLGGGGGTVGVVMASGLTDTYAYQPYGNICPSEWNSVEITNNLSDARNIWWKLGSRLAATSGGRPLPISNAATPAYSAFNYFAAAVAPSGQGAGIAAVCLRSSPDNADTDGDDVPDGYELALGMDPSVPSGVMPDSDSDGMPDWWETLHNLNPHSASDAEDDPDSDGLTNRQEYDAKTDPHNKDTDGDGMLDGEDDNPLVPDSDRDGIPDQKELFYGTDPSKRDTDGDGMPDGWEVANKLNPLVNDVSDDFDGDGLSNFAEYENGSRADLKDTDGDGTKDGDEVNQGSDPNSAADNGQPPPQGDILSLPFRLDGDWAAWEMTVASISPADTRTLRFSMGSPGAAQTRTFKLHRGNAYRVTLRWLGSGSHVNPYWYCWGAQIGDLPALATYTDYSSTRRSGVAETISGDGWFADNSDGLLTSHVHMKDGGGGNVAGGLSATLYVLKAGLIPDFDRNGEIDESDRRRAANGEAFRFWINDDADIDANTGSNVPGSANPDCADNVVNGLRDMPDWFPVMLDLGQATGMIASDQCSYWLCHEGGAVNILTDESGKPVVLFDLGCKAHVFDPAVAGSVAAGKSLQVPPGGIMLDASFIVSALNGKATVLLEGRSMTRETGACLTLEARAKTDGTLVCRSKLFVSLGSVTDMYRQLNLRSVCGGTGGMGTQAGEPPNLPDSETDAKHVVYLHGYNINGTDAVGEQSAVFKNLWWCGSRARFHGVSWFGDATQIPAIGLTPNFYTNGANAFATAPYVSSYVEELAQSGDVTVIAHSLGNMVASAAICLYHAPAANYLMLDAAVAQEAYRSAALMTHNMVNANWADYTADGYPNRLFASEWHTNFNPPDARSALTLRGLFTDWGDASVCNFYSSGEDILDNAPYQCADDWSDNNGLDAANHVWCAQEKLKGRIPGTIELTELPAWWGVWAAGLVTGLSPEVADLTALADSWLTAFVNEAYPYKHGGWVVDRANLVNCYSMPTDWFGVPRYRRKTVAEMLDPIITGEAVWTRFPLFTLPSGLTDANDASASAYAADNRLFLLAHVFPATTYAMGKNQILDNPIQNWNMNDLTRCMCHGWWESDKLKWEHCDFKNVCLLYTQELYKEMARRGGLN